ncbi:transporter substrate-binding domain-containing protein [Roseibium sp.]|uniref:transporter substrate-binding domain-containing protein n=1 Tax=Roseibium sp. TaxID=1936156 RepID=UPI003B52C100
MVAALANAVSTVYADERPVVLTTHNLSPYGSYQEDGRFDGIAVRVVACVFEKMNRPLEIRVMPWKRAQLEVQSGSADGFFAASRNHDRDTMGVASAVIARQTWTWYLLKTKIGSPRDPGSKSDFLVSSFLGANMQS